MGHAFRALDQDACGPDRADCRERERENRSSVAPVTPNLENGPEIAPGAFGRSPLSEPQQNRQLRRTPANELFAGPGPALHAIEAQGAREQSEQGQAGVRQTIRPRLVILNVMLVAVGIAAWRAGYLAAFALLGRHEIVLLVVLGMYTAVGLGAAWNGRWDTVRRVANALPAWGLAFTGIGLLLAAASLHALTPAALSSVFRALVFAVAPNIAGVLGFAWLTALANWAAGEDT